jgi:hypothetical protein
MEGRGAIGILSSETTLNKPSESLSNSLAGPEQLSIYFDGGGLKCG